MRRLPLLVALLILLPSAAPAADQELYPSAAVGSRWLNVPGSARVASLAGAFAARGAEPGGLESNPAALAGLRGWQAYFTHNAWVEGMAVERLNAAMHFGCLGTAALTLDYLDLGEVERYGLDAGGQPVARGTVAINSWAVAAAWAGDFGPLALGANLRTLGENLATQDSNAFQGDLGARYSFRSGLRTGLAVRNLSLDFGPALKPLSLRAGLGWTWDTEMPLALDLNADYQTQDGEAPSLRAAAEWAPARSLILRGGWIAAPERSPHGPTAGLGWLSSWGEIDYAVFAAGELGLSHMVTLRVLGWQE